MADEKPPAFNVTELPPEVADELAAFLRSHLTGSHNPFYSSKLKTFSAANTGYKDDLQDVQSQISNVIEPASDALVPVARELKSTFDQIDRLEYLINKIITPQIKDLSTKVDRTEQLVRWEERALNEGRRVDLWKGVDMGSKSERKMFHASDYFDEHGKFKDLSNS